MLAGLLRNFDSEGHLISESQAYYATAPGSVVVGEGTGASVVKVGFEASRGLQQLRRAAATCKRLHVDQRPRG